jgi:phosphoglycerate kinase
MKNLTKINFQNIKNVAIRVDFNVPINDSFQITDNTRLIRAKNTIDFVSKNESKILLLSHFGRPKESFDEKFSFTNLIDQFSNILGHEIHLLSYEEFLQNGLQKFKKGTNKITLLDNIRFFEGEKKNDKSFSQSITNELDLFINEAFSASHRSHASVNQMAKNILSAPGLNFSKEVIAINEIKNSTKRKLAIIGGSKVSTKIKTLLSLTQSCSNIFIGGAMANNFLKHQGIVVGQSLLEEGSEEMVKDIYTLARKTGCEIHLPTDVVLDNEQSLSIEHLSKQNQFSILDLSDNSIEVLEQLIQKSEIVLWNGPMGMIEDPRFAKGSSKLAHLLAKSSCDVVIGGGDTLLAINIAGVSFDNYHFVSTAGGAFLEALEDKELPGIIALQ